METVVVAPDFSTVWGSEYILETLKARVNYFGGKFGRVADFPPATILRCAPSQFVAFNDFLDGREDDPSPVPAGAAAQLAACPAYFAQPAYLVTQFCENQGVEYEAVMGVSLTGGAGIVTVLECGIQCGMDIEEAGMSWFAYPLAADAIPTVLDIRRRGEPYEAVDNVVAAQGVAPHACWGWDYDLVPGAAFRSAGYGSIDVDEDDEDVQALQRAAPKEAGIPII